MDPDLPHQVIAACLEVHRQLGPGWDREAYEECVMVELKQRELAFHRGERVRFQYRGQLVETRTRLDLVVADALLLQVAAQEEVTELDLARVESLLKLSGLKTALLVNFNVMVLRKGVHQVRLRRRSEPEAEHGN